VEPDVRIAYCQHCKKDVPMPNTLEEHQRIAALRSPLRFDNGKVVDGPALEAYYGMTGYRVADLDELDRHMLMDWKTDRMFKGTKAANPSPRDRPRSAPVLPEPTRCKTCGRPLRTEKASYCIVCGTVVGRTQ
jgi:hypothetical protein